MLVQLKSSKTDIFRQGQSLTVASTLSTLCTVTAMQEYFLLAKPERGPLFYFQSGRYLTRSTVSHLLRNSDINYIFTHRCATCNQMSAVRFHVNKRADLPAGPKTGLVRYLIRKLHGNEVAYSCDQRLFFSPRHFAPPSVSIRKKYPLEPRVRLTLLIVNLTTSQKKCLQIPCIFYPLR